MDTETSEKQRRHPQLSELGAEDSYDLGNLQMPDARTPPPVKPRRAVLPWSVAALALLGLGAGLWLWGLPLAKKKGELDLTLQNLQRDFNNQSDALREAQKGRAELEAAQQELAAAVLRKQDEVAALTAAQEELAKKLEEEIQKGDITVNNRNGELVVDVGDRVLFDSGDATVSERGKSVLQKMCASFVQMQSKVIQVAGHTDDVPISPKLVKDFPSNWELSTARANNVVRYLQDDCKVPGERLYAAGYSSYRPVSSNRTKQGRGKNRRIEISLLTPPPKPGAEAKP